MKAIRVYEFGTPNVLKIENVNMPEAQARQVVVQVEAAGVNPVETYMRSGSYARLPTLPYTPGTDAGGTVAAVGTGVDKFAVGDRVFTSNSVTGTYAEFAVCEQEDVHPLPSNVSEIEGACLGVPYTTAYLALFSKARVQQGEVVLIHGATGGVGIAAVQLAHRAGCRIIATGGTQKGKALVYAQGADEVLDHTEPNCLSRIADITDGRGVNVILEMAAHINLGKDLAHLARGGRVIVIGSRGEVNLNARDLMSREGIIYGMSLMNAQRDELAIAYQNITTDLSKGELRPITGAQFPLDAAAQAHEQIMQSGAYGKIVLLP